MVFYTLTVESPESIAGDYDAYPPKWCPQLWEGVMTFPLVDAGGDASKLRRRDVVNKIGMHIRSDRKSDIQVCKQLEKLLAKAIILVHKHNQPVQDHIPEYPRGSKAWCNVPVFLINRSDGQAISKASEAGPVVISLVSGVKDLYSFGAGDSGQLGMSNEQGFQKHETPQRMCRDKSIKLVGCGMHHSVCLLDSGQVFAWGNNEYGQLGSGDRVSSTSPRYVEALADVAVLNLAVGGNHNLVCAETEGCWSWGWNDYKQLGHGEGQDQDEPAMVSTLGDKQVLDIAAGYMHSMAIVVNFRQTDEEIAQEHRLKQTALKAQRLKSDKVDKLAEWNKKNTLSIKDQKAKPNAEVRTLYTWGDGGKGQLGHGDLYTIAQFKATSGSKESTSQMKQRNFTCTAAPRKSVALLPKDGQPEHPDGSLVKIFARGSNSAAITTKGFVLTWGDNTYGQLGLGDKKHRGIPERITKGWQRVGKAEEKVQDLCLGSFTMMALSTHNHIYSWGRGSQGCLGYGPDKEGAPQLDDQLYPRLIEKVSARGCTEFACGDSHAMVRTSLGQAYIWGISGQGRLGLETMEDGSEVPDVVDEPMLLQYFEQNDIQVGQLAGGGAHTFIASQEFPADDVAGKGEFSSRMEVPGAMVVGNTFFDSACCVIS